LNELQNHGIETPDHNCETIIFIHFVKKPVLPSRSQICPWKEIKHVFLRLLVSLINRDSKLTEFCSATDYTLSIDATGCVIFNFVLIRRSGASKDLEGCAVFENLPTHNGNHVMAQQLSTETGISIV
jgi:hypothetical protein